VFPLGPSCSASVPEFSTIDVGLTWIAVGTCVSVSGTVVERVPLTTVRVRLAPTHPLL
jgi:hypothetical protein